MKILYPFLFTALIGIFGSAGVMAQWDTIAIDFGAEATISDEPWNNMTNPDGQIVYLKNSENLIWVAQKTKEVYLLISKIIMPPLKKYHYEARKILCKAQER